MAKQKTFEQARQGIFAELQRRGWALKTGLKTPRATSPSGNFRLWFRPQAVHFTEGAKHDAGEARPSRRLVRLHERHLRASDRRLCELRRHRDDHLRLLNLGRAEASS